MRKPIHAAATNEPQIIAMQADVTIAAAEGDGAKKGPRKFDVVAYTGGKLNVEKFDLPVVVDLKGLSFKKAIVANLDHDRKLRVGHVTARHNDGQSLRLEGLASAATASRDEVVASADDGFQWQASIEALPKTKVVKVPAGKTIEVNGQQQEGPFYVARKSVLGGFAFLSHGADENTTVKIAASAAPSKENAMDEKWIEAAGFTMEEFEALTDKQKAGLKKKHDAEIQAAEAVAKRGKKKTKPELEEDDEEVVASLFDVDEIKAGYSELVASIEAAFAEHEDNIADRKKLGEIKAGAYKEAKALKAKALKEKWPTHKLENESIKASSKVEVALVQAERPVGPQIHGSSRDLTNDIIEAALCQTLGMPTQVLEDSFDEKTLDAAHKHFKGRLGLQQTIIMAAVGNGYHLTAGERIHAGNLKRMLRFAFPRDEMIEGASTLSLSTTFSNVATKEVLAGFLEEDQSWREIAQVKPVSDFKEMKSFRLNDNMEYEEVGTDGKIAHGQLGEESYTRQAKTYAKMFDLTRVDIINDDAGALNDLRTRLGRGSARKFNNLFWTKFLDNSAFFTAGRGNYITGATTTLLVDGVGLQLAIEKLDKLVDASGKRIGGSAALLLTPPELQFAAQRLHQSTFVNTGGSATAETVGNANIHAGKYRPVKQVRLSDSTFTGYSTTAWYLLRLPTELAAMVVSFLNGVESPTVETADANFDTLGVSFRGYHDFGADLAEYLCGIKSKGAA